MLRLMQYIPHITSMGLRQVDFQVVIQLLRLTSRTFLAMRKASVRSLELEMVISLWAEILARLSHEYSLMYLEMRLCRRHTERVKIYMLSWDLRFMECLMRIVESFIQMVR